MHCHIVGQELETLLDKLLDAVPGLTTLTTLDIYLPYSLDYCSFYLTKLGMITVSWPNFAANLTTLSPMYHWKKFTSSYCPILCSSGWRNFSIVLHIVYPTSEPNELIWKSLLPFLIDHNSTLQSLKLEALEKVDMSSILTDLQHTYALPQEFTYLPAFCWLGIDELCRPPLVPRGSSIPTSASHLPIAILLVAHWLNQWIFQPRVVSCSPSWTSIPLVWPFTCQRVLWRYCHIILSVTHTYCQVSHYS